MNKTAKTIKLPNREIYFKWKGIMDKYYSRKIPIAQCVLRLVFLLQLEKIKIRPGHELLGWSIFVYDKEEYSKTVHKPLGLGLTYKKPNGIKTQDIFLINPIKGNGKIECYYGESEMIKKYPSMKGVHKDNLPV